MKVDREAINDILHVRLAETISDAQGFGSELALRFLVAYLASFSGLSEEEQRALLDSLPKETL